MNNLNSTQKSYVLNSINKALSGLSTWQGADVSYSNMYMMGMVNCIICGEAPGVNETLGAMSAQHGYKLLNDCPLAFINMVVVAKRRNNLFFMDKF